MIVADVERDLEEMIRLFEADDWHHWAEFFRKALALFRANDSAECGKHILSGSAGMGSLNDVILGQTTNATGQFEWKPDYKESNNKYQALLARLYGFGRQASRHKKN